MKSAKNIAELFPRHLFWDMDPNRLHVGRDKSVIIPRALYATTEASFEADIKRLESLYSNKQILSELRNTRELISNKVCSMVSNRYHVEEFARFR